MLLVHLQHVLACRRCPQFIRQHPEGFGILLRHRRWIDGIKFRRQDDRTRQCRKRQVGRCESVRWLALLVHQVLPARYLQPLRDFRKQLAQLLLGCRGQIARDLHGPQDAFGQALVEHLVKQLAFYLTDDVGIGAHVGDHGMSRSLPLAQDVMVREASRRGTQPLSQLLLELSDRVGVGLRGIELRQEELIDGRAAADHEVLLLRLRLGWLYQHHGSLRCLVVG
mmetsp:Transcript_2303/g.6371  ORF Transcript_2303/g.6371 Transcript_2303/m.6371 type:complete len:224 (+) Transcript_2303:1503-2174(+)